MAGMMSTVSRVDAARAKESEMASSWKIGSSRMTAVDHRGKRGEQDRLEADRPGVQQRLAEPRTFCPAVAKWIRRVELRTMIPASAMKPIIEVAETEDHHLGLGDHRHRPNLKLASVFWQSAAPRLAWWRPMRRRPRCGSIVAMSSSRALPVSRQHPLRLVADETLTAGNSKRSVEAMPPVRFVTTLKSLEFPLTTRPSWPAFGNVPSCYLGVSRGPSSYYSQGEFAVI